MRLAAATAPTSTQFSNAELILYRYPNETWWNTTNFKCFLYVDILWKILSTKSLVFRHLDHEACRRKSLMEKIKAFRPSHNQSTASGWCSTDVISEIFPNLNLPTVPLRNEPRGPRFHKWPPGGFCWKLGAFLWDFQEIPTGGSDDDAALDGRHPAPVYRYCLPLITAFFWLQLPENHPMQPIILINPVMNLRNRPLNDPSLHEHSFKKWIDMNEQLNSQLKRKITKKQLKDNISGAFFLLVTKKKSVVVNRFIPY